MESFVDFLIIYSQPQLLAETNKVVFCQAAGSGRLRQALRLRFDRFGAAMKGSQK